TGVQTCALPILTGSSVGSPRLETTESGREFLMMTIYDRSERREYEVAVLDQASRDQVADLGHGDLVTVRGDYRPGAEVNPETRKIEIKHRLVARRTFTDFSLEDVPEQMTGQQFTEYHDSLTYDVLMERERALEMEEEQQNAGAEQSLREFLAENPEPQKGLSLEELEAHRVMAEQRMQAELQRWGPEGPPF